MEQQECTQCGCTKFFFYVIEKEGAAETEFLVCCDCGKMRIGVIE